MENGGACQRYGSPHILCLNTSLSTHVTVSEYTGWVGGVDLRGCQSKALHCEKSMQGFVYIFIGFVSYLRTSASFSCSSSPCRPRARIIPSPSISTVWGILLTAYSLAASQFQYFRSVIYGQVMFSFLIASFQESALWSKDTPTISKFLFLYLAYASTRFGISRRQGPHQLAQKSTSTVLPFPT